MIDSLAIIGSGNTAWQLGHQFIRAQLPLHTIITRNQTEGRLLANELGISWKSFDSDVVEKGVFLCVADAAIKEVSEQLRGEHLWMVHCSGSIALQAISGKTEKGVFYPLQTMSKGRLLETKNLPICLEANNDGLLQSLQSIVHSIGSPFTTMDSEQRKKAHLSAVMVNNFVNHLLHMSQNFAEQNGVDANILQPLIRETIEKFIDLGGRKAQTGPAKRRDAIVIDDQEELLSHQPALLKLYQSFTQSILHEFSRT